MSQYIRYPAVDSSNFVAKVGGRIPDVFTPQTSSQTVYVDKSGNDSTGTGSLQYPYLTLTKALSSITDATTNKRYIVRIGPGVFQETAVVLIPFVYIIGQGFNYQTAPTNVQVTGAGNNVTLGTGFNTSSRVIAGVKDVFFGGSTNVLLDFQTPAVSSSNPRGIVFDNTFIVGTLTLKAYQQNDLVDINNQTRMANLVAHGGRVNITNSEITGNFTMDVTGEADTSVTLFPEIFSTIVFGNVSFTSSASVNITAAFLFSTLNNGLTIDQATTTVEVDAVSYPLGTLSQTNGGILVLETQAKAIAYTPGDSTKWTNPQPTTVQQALDRIAAKIGPIA